MTSVIKVLRRSRTGRAVWHGPDLADSDEWVLRLTPAQIDELEAALRVVRDRGVPLLKVSAGDFPLVSQNAAGHVLGHARDTGRTMADPATRGYQTREGLPFHTGGSDVLGLLCLQSARWGARTAVVSSAAIYNAVLARRPDLVERLYRRHFLDRREEQATGERPYYAVPLACWYGGKLSIRYHRGYLESAQRFPEVPRLEPADVELFDLIDELAGSPELRLDVDFEVGDLLLLNNHAVLHSRTEYEDHAEAERKRHVLRLWLALRQGRDLPPGLWGDPHIANGPGSGGIAPRDVIARQHTAAPAAPIACGDRHHPEF